VYSAPNSDILTVPGSAQTTLNYYDALGRLDSIVNPGGRSISPTGYQARKQSWALRDGLGNPRWEYPGNGTYVARVFDARGRVTSAQLSQDWSVTTGPDGERFADVASKGWYDSMQLPMGTTRSAGVNHSYTYDGKERLTGTGSQDLFLGDTSYTNRYYGYSRSDQVVSEKVFYREGGMATVMRRYQYNKRGQRTLATDSVFAAGVPDSESVGELAYTYNSGTSRLDSIVASHYVAGTKKRYAAVRYQYDVGGRETRRGILLWPTGGPEIVTTTTYDALNRILAIHDGDSVGHVHYDLASAGYDAVSNLKTYISSEPGVTTGGHTYSYATDGTNRLSNTTEGAYANAWTYDVLGNRLSDVATSTISPTPCGQRNQVYDADNRLIRAVPPSPGGPCHISRYWTDQAGNRLGESDTTQSNIPGAPPVAGLYSVMSYTAQNQLYFSVTASGDLSKWDYNWHWYDAEGRRVMSQISSPSSVLPYPDPRTIGGPRTYYIYDGNDVAMELTRTGGTWSVDRRFLSGGTDQPLAGRFNVGGTYENLALIPDRAGSIVRAIKSTGSEETNGAYFPHSSFGALIGVTGSGGSPLGGVGYSGAGTPNARGGFVYLRNRWYDPQSGRFLTQDPIGMAGGVNLYSYAGNNPIAYADPFGLCDPVKDPGCRFAMLVTNAGAGALENVVNDIGEHTGINDLGRGADNIIHGNIAKGGTQLAMGGLMVLGGPEADASEAAAGGAAKELISAAEKAFPKKVGFELHHIIPKYLGGAVNGLKARIPAAYHQLITNEFRHLWPYGSGVPSAEKLGQILKAVYSKLPLP
jgi:RHS repeat-associated protein